jgi:hypothetical protein
MGTFYSVKFILIIMRVIFETDFIGSFLLVPDWKDEQWFFDELVLRLNNNIKQMTTVHI